MSKTIVPLGDRIIVRRQESEQKTAGGIVLPDSAKDKPNQGEVIAVGPGKRSDDGKRTPLDDLKVGDVVLFGQYAGNEVKVGDKTLIVLREDDIMGKIA